MTEKIVSLLLVAFMVTSCALERANQHPVGHDNPLKKVAIKPKTPVSKKTPEEKNKALKRKAQVLWELTAPEEITLILMSVDTEEELNFPLIANLSYHPITRGHWQVVGFKIGEEEFHAMNTTQKFVFTVKKSRTYAGTLIAQCPKVGPEHLPELKVMKFFNRYPFSSKTGLCELVIGNDFANVVQEFKKDPKSKDFSLSLGF